MRASRSILNDRTQLILTRTAAKLIAPNCRNGEHQLTLFDFSIIHLTIKEAKIPIVRIRTTADLFQRRDNHFRIRFTKMLSEFLCDKVNKGLQFLRFGCRKDAALIITNDSRLLCSGIQGQQKLSDLSIGATQLNGGAVVGYGDGFHDSGLWAAPVVRRWWNDGTPERTPATSLVPLVKLSQLAPEWGRGVYAM